MSGLPGPIPYEEITRSMMARARERSTARTLEENAQMKEALTLLRTTCKAAGDRLRELEGELRTRAAPRPQAKEARRKTAYLAGPMRGLPYYNFPAFDAARDALQAGGWDVTSPADLDRANGFDAMRLPPDTDWSRIPEGFDLPACVRRDVDALTRCDALVFLPGDWTKSTGGKGEFAVALWARKPVYQLSPDGSLARVFADMRVVDEPVEVRLRHYLNAELGGMA